MDALLVKRSVVEVENGILYEGEWVKNQAGVRMGRGA